MIDYASTMAVIQAEGKDSLREIAGKRRAGGQQSYHASKRDQHEGFET